RGRRPPRLLVSGRAGRTVASLRQRNFRLFFVGQLLSSVGTWLHQVSETWLVYKLTGNGFAMGAVVLARFVPVLVLGMWGGAIADRFDKRKTLYITQSVRGGSALVLGIWTLVGEVHVVTVLALAFTAGLANAIDNPVRRAFISELVDDDLVLNAVSLNSTVMATSRVVGPLLAGALIATVGVGWSFTINGISYVAMIASLAAMDASRFRARRRRNADSKATVADGLRYICRTRELWVPLAMVGVVSAFAWNWEILLAVMATDVFGGGARLYTVMFAVLSVGTFFGALFNAGQATIRARQLVTLAGGLGVAMAATSMVPWLALLFVGLLCSGIGAAMFNTASNAVVQVTGRGEYHGRVMAVFTTLFVGTKGIGGTIAGGVMQRWGSRWAIAVCGLGCLAAAAIGALGLDDRIPKTERHSLQEAT
ncbi:MAG TPA: MFS transporter, partial [Ilumatobacteraceae bacterium]|nr:MFS transporter [Ilumatobacteraceae bacterium]